MTERSSQETSLEDRFPEFTSLYFALRTISFNDERERDRLLNVFKNAPNKPLSLETLALVVVDEKAETGVIRRKEGSKKKIEGLIVVLDDPLALQPQLETIDQLAFETQVWVFEKGHLQTEEDRAVRLATLEAAGIVKRKLVEKDGFICWTGRTKKERRRIEVDLTKKPWFAAVERSTKNALLNQGWEKVDLAEVLDSCRHTTFPLLDLSNLKHAFGSRLVSGCGCAWHLTKDGTWNREKECSSECSGKPYKYVPEEQRFYLGDNIPAEKARIPSAVCYDCGAGILVNRRRITGTNNGDLPFTEVHSEMFCPHCGSIGGPKRLTVGTYKIVEYSPKKEDGKRE